MAASARDLKRLEGVHPRLSEVCLHILDKLPMCVTQGVRTTEEQQRLYAIGRTTPGRIVTNLDGVHKRSNHQPRGLYGHAVDMAFLGPLPYDLGHPWAVYGALAEAEGAIWGGRWVKKLVDRPHIEWP